MNGILLLAALVLIAPAGTAAEWADISGAWVPVKLQWQPAPATVSRHLRSSQTEVLYLSADGTFAVIDCTIYEERKTLTVSKGDAQGVYLGTWRRAGSEVFVKYHLAYRTIEVSGKHGQEEQREASLTFPSPRTLLFRGQTFRREPRLTASVEDDVRGIRTPPAQPRKE
jgi:hypothetical protein